MPNRLPALRFPSAAAIVLSLFLSGLQGENLVKVELDGKSLVIDTDSYAVQQNLKPANPQAGAKKLPEWLYPSPGQEPIRSSYDARTGIASAVFASGGTVDQVVAYYGQLLKSKGYAGGTPMGSPTSKMISGKSASGTISVTASVPFRNPAGGTEFTVTLAPTATKSNRKHFEVAWFDPARALLCLRDTATSEEYYLDARSIGEANLNRPGAVKSEGAPYPSWFPLYPGAHRPAGKITFLMEPTAVFQTADPIRAVYDFYRTALPGAGARVLSSNITRSGTPLRDFSASFKAQMGDDVVEIQIGEIMNTSPLLAGAKPLQGTGIGVRYTVPRR
ncbi:MAG TPA: hypothetical protein VGP79_04820 [Bryobacteraceae bacterium]|jgi:hypothetical protein|nr:hypothetical protein [Bryobacteraceae bacterium]